MEQTDPHLYRPDRVLMWNAIADRIQSDSDCLSFALDNIESWLKSGRLHPAPLREWRERITEAFSNTREMFLFLQYLREDNHDSEQLKSCSPFPGLLAKEELAHCYRSEAAFQAAFYSNDAGE